MGKIVYITGGARSGKSSFGEEYIERLGKKKIYIATAKVWDIEMQDRVDKHKNQRGNNWLTIEAYRDLDKQLEVIKQDASIFLDCITNMISNIILEEERDWDAISLEEVKALEEEVMREIGKLIRFADNHLGELVLVSNELGMGLVPPYPLGRHFRDIAGRVNQYLAKIADEAYLIVSGLEVKLK